eukprot:353654-Chlamydomonas_euryale.AAC.2
MDAWRGRALKERCAWSGRRGHSNKAGREVGVAAKVYTKRGRGHTTQQYGGRSRHGWQIAAPHLFKQRQLLPELGLALLAFKLLGDLLLLRQLQHLLGVGRYVWKSSVTQHVIHRCMGMHKIPAGKQSVTRCKTQCRWSAPRDRPRRAQQHSGDAPGPGMRGDALKARCSASARAPVMHTSMLPGHARRRV